jgi:hypothetical protein
LHIQAGLADQYAKRPASITQLSIKPLERIALQFRGGRSRRNSQELIPVLWL